MKLPYGLRIECERLARLLLAGTISWEEALDELEPLLGKLEYKLFVSELNRRFLRQQLKNLIAAQLQSADDEEDGQQQLPFPDLSAYVEIAPGRRVHQNAMTLKDWDAAVVQAEVKATNAAGHAERIRAARDKAYEAARAQGEATG